MSATGSVKRLISRVLARRRVVINQKRIELRWGYTTPRMRRFEDAEVRRITDSLESIPTALVATIVPTYRRPQMLQRAVQSALAQSISDQVVIVVDDGAGLPELPDDPRLFAVSLSRNTAVAGVVRNVGIRISRSKYVAFLDDDNEWDDNHLEVALRALGYPDDTRPPADVVYTAIRRVHPDGEQMDLLSTPFDRKLLARKGYIDINSAVIRRFDGLHFCRLARPAGKYPGEDWELIYRISRRHKTMHVPVATASYLINPESYWISWPARD
jgi:Glycosyl transferase family 2